jgi:hypothetical protein
MERDEVIKVINEVDERVASLRARMEAHADAPLPTGEWRVRDAASHLAARSNPVANVLRRVEAADAQAPNPPPRVNIDEINHGQVEERADRSIQEILDELQAGHRATIANLPPDDMLARTLPAVQGGEITVGEMIARSGARHEQNHLNDIEQALVNAESAVKAN